MKKLQILFIAVTLMAATAVTAQLKTPAPSPTATIEQAVGLGTVTVEYSRPGVKDRSIFGGLVPYGEMWRTGANASTKIEFSEDVNIGGKDVPAGKYALYSIPTATSWTIVISKNLELWGSGGYDEADDQTRFTVKSMKTMDKTESFTIDFSNFTTEGAHLNMTWENTTVAIPIKTAAMATIEKDIEKIMAGPDANTYYRAARFYLENDKELDQAYGWISKACKMRPEAFWMMHQKAKMEAKMGKKTEAIASAKKSLEMAKTNEDGDFGYISNNEELLKELGVK